ncbi:unnamed protein product [Ceratitis capitata]|uniref:(Mediterranean fruit fly) hypothetical protein n=1 Tax=Ceratitis capitata TaxID=7213 RepID=A0A811UIK5_CERCA|nr:unnamed protein product [Ceratitis capitata]
MHTMTNKCVRVTRTFFRCIHLPFATELPLSQLYFCVFPQQAEASNCTQHPVAAVTTAAAAAVAATVGTIGTIGTTQCHATSAVWL